MDGEQAIARYLALLSGSSMSKTELRTRFGALAFVFYDEKSLVAVRDFLREFTAEWIDSGFAEDGSEWPSRRNFTPKFDDLVFAESAMDAEGPPLSLLPIPHAVRAIAKCVGGFLQVSVSRSGASVYQITPRVGSKCIGRPPTMVILPAGGFSYLQSFHLPAFGSSGEEVGKEEGREEYFEILAANFFMEFTNRSGAFA